ncbi:MAG: hypothetical protein ACXW2T_07630, partial [Allosphingosinicella sp.]
MSRIVIGLVALAMAAILFLSERPWGLTSNPRVDEIAVLPDDPRLSELRRQIQWGDSLYPYVSSKAQAEAAAAAPRLKYGWTYREWNMLGMPFAAYEESGFAAFVEMRGGLKLALIDDDSRALIEAVVGRDPAAGYAFPWLKHVWGWLIVFGLALWQVLSLL